jgi:hypothetical protein
MQGTRTARLEVYRPSDGWRMECTSPCEVMLPIDATYRVVDGGRVQGPAGFQLKPRAGRVVIDVSASNFFVDILGGTVGAVGGSLVYGAFLCAADDESDNDKLIKPFLGVGALAAVLGTVMIVVNRPSVKQIEPAASEAPSPRMPEARSRQNDVGAFAPKAPTGIGFAFRF